MQDFVHQHHLMTFVIGGLVLFGTPGGMPWGWWCWALCYAELVCRWRLLPGQPRQVFNCFLFFVRSLIFRRLTVVDCNKEVPLQAFSPLCTVKNIDLRKSLGNPSNSRPTRSVKVWMLPISQALWVHKWSCFLLDLGHLTLLDLKLGNRY